MTQTQQALRVDHGVVAVCDRTRHGRERSVAAKRPAVVTTRPVSTGTDPRIAMLRTFTSQSMRATGCASAQGRGDGIACARCRRGAEVER